jgi:hypothetical protein
MSCRNIQHGQMETEPCIYCQEQRIAHIESMLETLIRRTAPSEQEIAETIKMRLEAANRQFHGMKP